MGWLFPGRINTTVSIKQLAVIFIVNLLEETRETEMLTGGSSFFLVSITGQVEEGDFPDYDSLYCRLFWVCGQDWTVTAGQEEGVSQVSRSAAPYSLIIPVLARETFGIILLKIFRNFLKGWH